MSRRPTGSAATRTSRTATPSAGPLATASPRTPSPATARPATASPRQQTRESQSAKPVPRLADERQPGPRQRQPGPRQPVARRPACGQPGRAVQHQPQQSATQPQPRPLPGQAPRDNDGRRWRAGAQVSDDDVLIPAAGILDLLDNYAFVRTTGYLPGPTDVYVSLSMVRKFGLRKGDAITGMVKQSRDGRTPREVQPDGPHRQRQRRRARRRPSTGRSSRKLTPLYPAERLRLETEANQLIGRVIDIVAADRQGPARADREPVQGRQDDRACRRSPTRSPRTTPSAT